MSESAGTRILLIDASAILFADEDAVASSTSRNASVLMDDSPPGTDTAAIIFTSLWQRDLQALRAEQMVKWQRARTAAVKHISPTAYA